MSKLLRNTILAWLCVSVMQGQAVMGGGAVLGGKAALGGGSSGGGGAAAYITGCNNFVSGSLTESCSVSGVPAGAAIYVHGMSYGGATYTGALTDSGGGTPTALSGYPRSMDFSSGTGYLWQIPNVSAGSHTLSITWSASASNVLIMDVAVVSPANATSPTVANSSTGSSTTPAGAFNCSNVTATASGQTIFSFLIIHSGTTTITAGTTPQTMTMQSPSVGNRYHFETGNVASSGTNFVQYNSSGSGASYNCDTVVVH